MNTKFFMMTIPALTSTWFMFLFFSLNNKLILVNLPLITNNSMNIQLNIMLDWMMASFATTVLIITSFITMYSLSYIDKKEHKRFMLIMMLFVMSMITLITSNNLIMLLIGWDGLGLTSYILVIYYQNSSTNASGTITILSNRVGDIMLMMAFALLMMNMSWYIMTNAQYSLSIMILMLIAAISKSAQFPFSAWLPAAMAAPTPISALVHSSTLVTAGVYLMIRLSSYLHENTMKTLMIISLFSIIMASLAAMWEQDMKKIIALSTLSQIALMMFAIAINAKMASFFHMITHALFKSTMFLCAGNIIHMSNYQDMRAMGSMFKKTPLLTTSLGISLMALMSLPFLSSFFSKDAILLFLKMNTINSWLMMIMITTISMTTIYSLRMTILATSFFNKNKPDSFIDNNNLLSWPPYFMVPASIVAGSMLAWYTLPTQTFILPTSTFLMLMAMLLIGIILSVTLSFKSNKYIFTGKMSIFMWFIHILSSTPWNKTSHLSTLMTKKDNTWLEQTSAQGVFNTMNTQKMTLMLFNKNAMLMMIMIFITPPILLSLM
uniref:NADH-ubiquinone oxidoreductase chain 5 n=1 Tax=Parachtes riberai TaxID=2593099 RepID=A0A516IM67_9ARAC|nr:NADH dehydrogenase subunit 5 [Parachtes riberai]